MSDRELLKMALEAFEHGGPAHRLQAMNALRAALAEPVQEPVANTTTLRAMLECCLSWEPNACVLGNVTARQAITALRAALAEPVCKCDLRTRLVGDGCGVCNPELAAELIGGNDE